MSDEVQGPLSWRDVYKAVADAETRILAAVHDAAAAAEKRATALEKEVAAHEAQLKAIEQWQISFVAANQGRGDVFGSLRATVMLTVSIVVGMSAALTLITLVFQAAGITGTQ